MKSEVKREMGAVVETYLSIEELAKYLGVSEKTIRRWVLNQYSLSQDYEVYPLSAFRG